MDMEHNKKNQDFMKVIVQRKTNLMHNLLLVYFVNHQEVQMYVYDNWYLSSNATRTTDSHLKRLLNTSCCIHVVVPHDDGSRYARNL